MVTIDTELILVDKLKKATLTSHDSLDNLVNSFDPFLSKENYIKFLQIQAVFHQIVDEIYHSEELNQKIPNLKELARYNKVLKDLTDLNAREITSKNLPTIKKNGAIGWLYCAEGSNIGAAFLIKQAKKIGFSEDFAASHLAPHPDGIACHWKEFSQIFNTLDLSDREVEEVIEGAKEAFSFYKGLAREVFKSNSNN